MKGELFKFEAVTESAEFVLTAYNAVSPGNVMAALRADCVGFHLTGRRSHTSPRETHMSPSRVLASCLWSPAERKTEKNLFIVILTTY